MILRSFILLYLYIHIIHLWQSAISMPFAILLFILTHITAIYVSHQIDKQRLLHFSSLLWLLTPLGFEFIRHLLGLVDTAFAMYYPHLLIKWDLTYIPLRTTLYILFYSTLLFQYIPAYRLLEVSIRPFLFIVIFWEMRQFKLGVYSNLLTLLLSLILYSTLEITLLSQLLHPKLSIKKMLLNSVKVMIFSLIASLLTIPWVYEKAGPHMRSSEGLLRSNFMHFDFADSLKLESEISMGSKLLFLIQSDNILPNGLLLKRLTMSGYSQETGFFHLPDLDDLPSAKFGSEQEWPLAKHQYTQPNTMEIYLINMANNIILSPYELSHYQQVRAKNMHQFKEIFHIEFYDILPKLRAITALSDEPLKAKSHLLPNYTASIQNNPISPEIQNLAKEITDGINGDYAKAKAIEEFFHTNYYYSLYPGEAVGADQLHHFLFSSRKGYCSYFATAMTLMLQSLDMVARVAGGFRISTQNQVLNYYAVTSAEAHSWVEVYFDGVGWVPFDPTSSQLYGSELILAGENHNLTDIYRFIEQITTLELITVSNPFKKLTWTEQSHLPANQKIQFVLLILFSLILLAIVYIFYQILAFTRTLTLHHQRSDAIKSYRRTLLAWMYLLDHPYKKDWQCLIEKNSQAKSVIEKIIFHPNPYLSELEISHLNAYIQQSQEYYKQYPLWQRWQITLKKSIKKGRIK